MEVGGGGTLSQSLRAITLGGHIAIIGVLGGAAEPLQMGSMIGTAAKLVGVSVGSRAMFEAMCRAIELHRIEPGGGQGILLSRKPARRSTRCEAGDHFGKIVLTF